ncbi:MAG: hypothetical protein M0017_00670 [Desulfobacteraceae bacterium]|nr:hypothetical protein [Desulfobacteraceae bacterium]
MKRKIKNRIGHFPKINKTKYAACFYFSPERELQNFEVVEGFITKIVNDEVEFTGVFQGQKQKVIFPRRNIFSSREDADKRIEAALAWRESTNLKKELSGNIGFLPTNIAEINEVFPSGNPLRCGEPMICFGAQTNTWGEDDNPQKVLQMAGAIWEDIATLKSVLYVLGFANNYTKKLIGKYIVIELNSLFNCLKRLSELDADYKITLFSELLCQINILEEKYKFRAIRNRVAAHRDTNIDIMAALELWQNITRYTLNRYVNVFASHLDELLKKYQFEAKSYFFIRNVPLKGIVGIQDTETYKTFDEPFIEEVKGDNPSL